MFNKSSEEKKFYLRSFQICSNQYIRGIATSDIEYNVTSFPKELSLKCKKPEDWFKEFNWISIGKMEDQEADPDLKNISSKKPKEETKMRQSRPKSSLKNKGNKKSTKEELSTSKKRVAFKLDESEVTNDNALSKYF